MFALISRLVIRRPSVVVLTCLALAAALWVVAPGWDQVTKDDNVRFFPPGFPQRRRPGIARARLPRRRRELAGRPRLRAHRRPPHTRQTSPTSTAMAGRFYQFAQATPALGFKKLDTYRTPVIGPRLLGDGGGAARRAVLTIVSLNGTYLAKTTRSPSTRILEWLESERARLPAGLTLAVTGSAVVGHDINTAANESIANTTWTTVILVVIILLIVYRSPLLAMVPLVTIALSVLVSLCAIALLTTVPGFGFQVINITRVFVVVVLFGAGTDYCLFLIARYSEELRRGRSRSDALREAIGQVGGALVASAGTVIVGLGMLFFSSFAKIKYTGPAIALSLAVALAASLTLAPALLALLRKRDLLAVPRDAGPPAARRPPRARRRADIGILGPRGRPGRPASDRHPDRLPAGPGPPGGRGCLRPRRITTS